LDISQRNHKFKRFSALGVDIHSDNFLQVMQCNQFMSAFCSRVSSINWFMIFFNDLARQRLKLYQLVYAVRSSFTKENFAVQEKNVYCETSREPVYYERHSSLALGRRSIPL
jgi:hypothetical protein